MSDLPAAVFIVDDDDAVRGALKMLMKSVNLPAEAFASAQAFLDTYDPERPGVLLLDIRMPGMSGTELQSALNNMRAILPIIFITGHGDVPMAVEAMRAGAVDFLQKPFRDDVLLDRIHAALARDHLNRKGLSAKSEIQSRIESLTPREKQVMELVVRGKANKVIAGDLGLSQRTVEIHRARVMEKLNASSLAHLVRMVIAVRGAVA